MIRGTTPTLEFILPFDTSLLAEAFVTIAQGGVVLINKTLGDCMLDGMKMTLRLEQVDTLKLKGNAMAEIQIRARTTNGDAIASDIMYEMAERILKDGAI